MVKDATGMQWGASRCTAENEERVVKLKIVALSIVATVGATPAMAQYWYAPGPYSGPYGGQRPYYAPARRPPRPHPGDRPCRPAADGARRARPAQRGVGHGIRRGRQCPAAATGAERAASGRRA